MSLKRLAQNKCWGGLYEKWSHMSAATKTEMKFSVFLPPNAIGANAVKVPSLYFLSGLTCNEDNFITKAGACQFAAESGIALICPDTSPRGANIDGEQDSYDFGEAAGFYVNATTDPWANNYRMYDYVTEELPTLLKDASDFPTSGKKSIFGHSMGGHGALICYLKNPGLYESASAFSPICHPSACPWGTKAFEGYLGSDREVWKQYDATELARSVSHGGILNPILIDTGLGDNFYEQKQLLPEDLEEACRGNGIPLINRLHEGYDHSYWFIQSFMPDHIRHHSKYLL